MLRPMPDRDPESVTTDGQSVAAPPSVDRAPSFVGLLDRRVGTVGCAIAWGLASLVFVLMVVVQYGPTTHDAIEWDTPAWTVAHGQPRCSYAFRFQTEPPPVFPLVVAGAEAAVHGMDVRLFAEQPVRATDCRQAFIDLSAPPALHDAATLGFLGWVVLLAGFVAALRAVGRGRSGWEVAGVIVLALLPPVVAALNVSIHPEDLMALGLLLAATARSAHRRDVVAGVLLGLAVATQQFALLAAVPIVVLADWRDRGRLVLGAVGAAVVVSVPFLATGASGMVHALAGGSATQPGGPTPTLIARLPLEGTALVAVSRLVPLALAAVLAGWWRRRGGASTWEPVALMALVAASLDLRLAFEVNLFLWYFASVSVTLLVLAASLGGRRRWWLLAWGGWNVVVAACYGGGTWGVGTVSSGLVIQVVVVGWAMALAVVPLAERVRRDGRTDGAPVPTEGHHHRFDALVDGEPHRAVVGTDSHGVRPYAPPW